MASGIGGAIATKFLTPLHKFAYQNELNSSLSMKIISISHGFCIMSISNIDSFWFKKKLLQSMYVQID